MLTEYLIAVLLVCLQHATALLLADEDTSASATPPDEVCEMVRSYNYSCDRHEVVTEDGYILEMSHIPGDKTKPVFMQHGFLDTAITWTLRGHQSPALFLANKRYDVWLGNTRGNMYSRRHVSLDPEDPAFWDFSLDELAKYDLPAMIDYILKKTNQTKVQVVAHSQGTSLVFILASSAPEYVTRIKNAICLAPVAYLDHAQSPLFPLLSLAGGPLASGAVGLLGHGELLSSYSALAKLFQLACTQGVISYAACGLGLASVLFGPDPEQFEPKFASKAYKYYPGGSSVKNGVHLLQIVLSGKFQQYDYGLGNMEKYNSLQPPLYDLSKVYMNISLYVGKNDRLSDERDAERLAEELGIVPEYYVMPYEKWNHVDPVWGLYMPEYLFGPMLETLKKFQ